MAGDGTFFEVVFEILFVLKVMMQKRKSRSIPKCSKFSNVVHGMGETDTQTKSASISTIFERFREL